MATLERRVEALEIDAERDADQTEALVVRLVRPGAVGAPVASGEVAGQVYAPMPGESEAQFIERLSALAVDLMRAAQGTGMVLLRS